MRSFSTFLQFEIQYLCFSAEFIMWWCNHVEVSSSQTLFFCLIYHRSQIHLSATRGVNKRENTRQLGKWKCVTQFRGIYTCKFPLAHLLIFEWIYVSLWGWFGWWNVMVGRKLEVSQLFNNIINLSLVQTSEKWKVLLVLGWINLSLFSCREMLFFFPFSYNNVS